MKIKNKFQPKFSRIKLIENPILQKIVKHRGLITTLVLFIFLIFLSRIVNEMGVNYIASQQERKPDGILIGAEPFFIQGDENKDIGVLLIHGYTSSPNDFKGLSKFLSERGLTIYAPLLPGHGTHPKNLKNIKYQQWQEAVSSALDKLGTKKKFVIGFSMGGVLALDLASKKDLDGIMTLNAAIFLANRYIPFIPLVQIVETYTSGKPEDIVFFINEKRVVYDSKPLHSVLELKKLINSINIFKITEPILIFQSENDETVEPKSAEHIYNTIQSTDKEIISLTNSTHSRIQDQQAAFQKVYEFINSH